MMFPAWVCLYFCTYLPVNFPITIYILALCAAAYRPEWRPQLRVSPIVCLLPIHSRGRRLRWSDLALLSNFLKPTHGCQSVLFLEVLKGGKILIFKTSYCRYPTNECFFENLIIPFFYCKEPLQKKLLLKFYDFMVRIKIFWGAATS